MNSKENSDPLELTVRQLLKGALGESVDVSSLGNEDPLIGAVPEFDSLAIVNLIVGAEERLDVILDDSELDASVFKSIQCIVDHLRTIVERDDP